MQLPSPMPDFVTPCLFVDIGNVFENYDNIDLSLLGAQQVSPLVQSYLLCGQRFLYHLVYHLIKVIEYSMMSFGLAPCLIARKTINLTR